MTPRTKNYKSMLAWDRFKKNRDTFINNCSQRFDIGTLYIIGCWSEDKKEIFIKIGITSRTVQERFATKTSMPYKYKILHTQQGNPIDVFMWEGIMHGRFKDKELSYQPKLEFSGSKTECFLADKAILDYIIFLKESYKQIEHQ